MDEIINNAGGNANANDVITRSRERADGESRAVSGWNANLTQTEGGKGASVKGDAAGKKGSFSPSVIAASGADSSLPEGAKAARLQGEAGPSGDDLGMTTPPAAATPHPKVNAGYDGSPQGEGFDGAAVTFAARSARLADEAEALYAEWTSSAKELGRDYPGFDLAAAAKEPAFGRLLRAGVDLRSAYEATHMPLVREAIRASAAAEAEARVLDGVRLRGLRPDENGARPGGAVLTGGMAGLSREQRARIAEKAMRGLLWPEVTASRWIASAGRLRELIAYAIMNWTLRVHELTAHAVMKAQTADAVWMYWLAALVAGGVRLIIAPARGTAFLSFRAKQPEVANSKDLTERSGRFVILSERSESKDLKDELSFSAERRE